MTRVEENNATILYITQVLEIGPSPMRMEGKMAKKKGETKWHSIKQ